MIEVFLPPALPPRRRDGRLSFRMSHRAFSTLACTLLLTAPALAQGLPWDIPHRGAIVYKRTVDEFKLRPAVSQLRIDWAVKGCEEGGHAWRHQAFARGAAPADFGSTNLDDRAWPEGKGLFGEDAEKTPGFRTAWNGEELVVRSRVDLGRRKPRMVLFRVHHDDGIRIQWNGNEVVADDGHGRNRLFVVSGKALDAWQAGENLLAVKCTNVGGLKYLDVAMGLVQTLPPGVKNADQLLAAMRNEQDRMNGIANDIAWRLRPPPMLLQGELATTQDRVQLAPADIRELAWHTAMDTSAGALGGAMSVDIERIHRFGDLAVKGRAEAVGPDGWQEVDLTVRHQPELLARDDGKRWVEMHVKPHVNSGIDARLRIRRRIELRDGKVRVASFRAELSGTVLRGKDFKEPVANLSHVTEWQFDRVHENQDAAFRAAVQEALKKGTTWLRGQLGDLGRNELRREGDDWDRTYHSGRLALAILALVKGGVPVQDEVVQKALAELRSRRLIDTYSLGNALMALEGVHAPTNEFGDLKAGAIDRPRKRTVPTADLELMRKWTAQLMLNVDTSVDTAYLLRFNYLAGDRYDHSVNQYGLLGLYSAHLCGVEVQPQVWEAAANHLISAQIAPIGRMDLDLLDYRTWTRIQSDPDARRTVVRLPVKPAGWHYYGPKTNGERSVAYGSMTAAGITGLAICQAGLLDHPQLKRPKLQGDATAARNAGLAWMAQNLQVRYHPGDPGHRFRWFYYYLYGLERAALLSGIAILQDRDWYFEGAMMLVLSQHAGGNWPDEAGQAEDIEWAAMAILFLKQSSLPVLTGQ